MKKARWPPPPLPSPPRLAYLAGLRYFRDSLDAAQTFPFATNLVEYIDLADRNAKWRPAGRQRDDVAPYTEACSWSVAGEFLNLTLALASICLALRCLEVFTLSCASRLSILVPLWALACSPTHLQL